MKHIFLLFFAILSFQSFAQISKMGGMASRVNDSSAYVTNATVIQAHADGYHDIWLSNASNLFWVWNGSAYVNWVPSGSGWATTGRTVVTDPVIDGNGSIILLTSGTGADSVFLEMGDGYFGLGSNANLLQLEPGSGFTWNNATEDIIINAPNFGVTTSTGAQLSLTTNMALSSANDVAISAGATGTGKDINITSTNGHVHFTTGTAGILATTTGPLTINTDPGTAGYYLQSNGPMAAPTWVAPSGGGFVSPTALTDGASISITSTNNTLTTTQSAITFSDGWTGNYSDVSVTFNQTSATWTFPAGALCVVEGAASGDNTAAITGTSGDKIEISIRDINGTNYRVAIKNFGQ